MCNVQTCSAAHVILVYSKILYGHVQVAQMISGDLWHLNLGTSCCQQILSCGKHNSHGRATIVVGLIIIIVIVFFWNVTDLVEALERNIKLVGTLKDSVMCHIMED